MKELKLLDYVIVVEHLGGGGGAVDYTWIQDNHNLI